MKALTELFAEAKAKYPLLKKTCDAHVSRWQWASCGLYTPEPFFHERARVSRGRTLKREPKTIKSGMHQYGFDANDHIVVVRQYTEFTNSFYEEFFSYSDSAVEGTLFDYSAPKEVVNVTRQTFRGKRIGRFERMARRGESTETYQYEGERLTSIQTVATTYGPPKEKHLFCDEISYDQIGRLSLIRRVYQPPSQSDWILYQRPEKGESVNALAEIIRRKLVRQIPETLGAARITDRAYCLVLSYTMEDTPQLPPTLAVGMERQRLAWVKDKGTKARGYVWNVAEFERSDDRTLQLNEAELTTACRLFNQEIGISGDWQRSRKLLNEVARELMVMDWAGTLDVTDDFIVFALDYEESDFHDNLKASVSPERLAVLKARGWL